MVARSTSESTANKYEETAIDINSVKDEKDCSFPNLLLPAAKQRRSMDHDSPPSPSGDKVIFDY